jgi:CRP/FNR family transcriptional regulator, transcriptional activator FtrB
MSLTMLTTHDPRGPATGRPIASQDLASALQVPLLASLPPHLLEAILVDACMLKCLAGDTLFEEGETPNYLHIVVEGEVGLYGGASDGEETLVNILQPGELFIAAAVLLDRPYLMTARALGPSRVLALPGARLRRDLKAIPDLALAMIAALSGHFRTLVREVKVLKLKSVGQRLALYLLSLTNKREGSAVVWLPHSKRTVAARIGARPESLSRAFSALRQQGVEVKGTKISIADVAALTAFCAQDDEPE